MVTLQRMWIGRRNTPEDLQHLANVFLQAVHAHGGEVGTIQYSTDRTTATEVYSLCVVYTGTADEIDVSPDDGAQGARPRMRA